MAESTPPDRPQMTRFAPHLRTDELDLLLDDVDHRPGLPTVRHVHQQYVTSQEVNHTYTQKKNGRIGFVRDGHRRPRAGRRPGRRDRARARRQPARSSASRSPTRTSTRRGASSPPAARRSSPTGCPDDDSTCVTRLQRGRRGDAGQAHHARVRLRHPVPRPPLPGGAQSVEPRPHARAARRAARARRSRPAWPSARSARTPAARSGARRPSAASSGSSRPTAAAAGPAC